MSQKELPFPQGGEIIFKTEDTKGIITYCNDAFVEISGYTREQLKEVMEAAVSMSQRIDHITLSSKEQSVTGKNVSRSLEQITGLVDQNARSAQQTRDAAVELAKSADELSKAGYPLTKRGMRNHG